MKKSFVMAALALATALPFTSCKDDTQPRLQPAPEGSFVLYEPADNNYTFLLSPESTITLTTNGQPDYGLATVVNYEVQISLLPDVKDWHPAKTDAEGNEIELPTYYTLKTVGTQSVITASCREIALGVNTMFGVKEETDIDKYDNSVRPIYVRIRAYVPDPKEPEGFVPYSEIYSNVMTLKHVQPYFVVPKPAVMYMIGNYQGWNIAGNEQTVEISEEENGIGSEIYTGYALLTSSQASSGFRFYKELGDWEHNGIGAGVDDANNTVELEDGVYDGDCFNGKGNWNITNWPVEAWMKITVNLNTMKVIFAVDENYDPNKK